MLRNQKFGRWENSHQNRSWFCRERHTTRLVSSTIWLKLKFSGLANYFLSSFIFYFLGSLWACCCVISNFWWILCELSQKKIREKIEESEKRKTITKIIEGYENINDGIDLFCLLIYWTTANWKIHSWNVCQTADHFFVSQFIACVAAEDFFSMVR